MLYIIYLLLMLTMLPLLGKVDVLLIGPVVSGNGIGQICSEIADCIKPEVTTSIIPTNKPIKEKDHVDRASIAVVTDSRLSFVMQKIPAFSKARIKIAYSMIESSKIPSVWRDNFNKYFDAVVVPDSNLVSVYQKSGVKIPVFVAPLPISLKPFLNTPLKTTAHHPFTFGVSANFGSGKNQLLLLEAFAQEFGNNPNIQLKIHGCWEWGNYFSLVEKRLNELGLTNVILDKKSLPLPEYMQFMSSLDCYVLISMGEGFSITPREAFALGLPCILSNVAAHKTICSTKLASCVQAVQPVINPFFKEIFGEECGFQYNSSVKDLRIELRQVYKNYKSHLQMAGRRREWSKTYLKDNLKNTYLALLKPKKVTKGKGNLLTNTGCLITNSNELYNKYMTLFNT